MTHIGLIVPPAPGEMPPEAAWMYPDVRFDTYGLGLRAMSEEGYAGVIDRTIDAAQDLKASGAEAVSVMGTSLSFFRGRAFETGLIERIAAATGLPVDTMASAVTRALRDLSARRIAVLTAYRAPVNRMLTDYLVEQGIEVMAIRSLDIEAIEDVTGVAADTLIAEARLVHDAAPDCDALLISCGGLRMADTSPPLRRALGKPVVTSAEAGLWGAVGLVDPTRAAPAAKVFA